MKKQQLSEQCSGIKEKQGAAVDPRQNLKLWWKMKLSRMAVESQRRKIRHVGETWQ